MITLLLLALLQDAPAEGTLRMALVSLRSVASDLPDAVEAKKVLQANLDRHLYFYLFDHLNGFNHRDFFFHLDGLHHCNLFLDLFLNDHGLHHGNRLRGRRWPALSGHQTKNCQHSK